MRIDPDLKEANRSKVFLAPVAVRLKGAESNLAPKKPKREREPGGVGLRWFKQGLRSILGCGPGFCFWSEAF